MSTASDYLVAANPVVEEININRSRFICYLSPCHRVEQVKEILSDLKKQHPQASHYCYAFIAGNVNNSQLYGFSDDGEPSGTAGKPMLSVLIGQGVGEVCAVVVRYFGGKKLGTGGLQRAYGHSVKQACVKLTTKLNVVTVRKTLKCQYTQVDDILYFIEQKKGVIVTKQYHEDVQLTFTLPIAELDDFQKKLQSLSAGQLQLVSTIEKQ